MKLCLTNALYLEASVDLLVEDGRVVTMMPAGKMDVPADCEVVDAQGKILLPSLTDCHVHMRDPGFEWKEDIATGLEAAARGGFGSVMCMPNTKPVNDSATVTRYMLEKAAKTHPNGPRLLPVAAATPGLKSQGLSPLGVLKEAGCVAVSNDGKPMTDTELMRRAMEYAWDLGMKFTDHCEDPQLAPGYLMNEGEMSAKLGVMGQPVVGEALQVARDCMLSEYLDIPVHIAHVSCAMAVDILAWAKARGTKVTAETCTHYLMLDETALEGYNTLAKVNPPLRTAADRDRLREAVKTGLVDIVVTDHAPHAAMEKETTLDLALNGFTGLDLSLTLMWQLVREGVLDQSDIVRLMATRPNEIFNLPCNRFNPGDPADFILFDPDLEWTVSRETLYSKSWNTPYLGQTMKGRVIHHWMGGVQLF
ncbi:MAG: dihydroorotase [Desulfovibrionaceae bacterium]|nr:dihydroorotase [Desulfovibrionaceae bacterium]